MFRLLKYSFWDVLTGGENYDNIYDTFLGSYLISAELNIMKMYEWWNMDLASSSESTSFQTLVTVTISPSPPKSFSTS